MQAGIVLGNLATVLEIRSQEAALVSELQAGSEEAYSWLIATYHQPIYSLVARTVLNSADASDLTQEVFLKVFPRHSQFPRRLQPAHLDLSHRHPRSLQSETLVVPPSTPGNHYRG